MSKVEKVSILFKSGTSITVEGEGVFDYLFRCVRDMPIEDENELAKKYGLSVAAPEIACVRRLK